MCSSDLLPRVMPVLPGFEIAGASVPATEAGGDYLDFVPLANGQLLLGIGDVSGHGLGPAQLVASARASIRILAGLDMALETVVSLVNERLVEDTNEEFMTLLLGVIDPREHSLVYFNAGHCRGLILDAAGAVRTTLESGGLPLGIRPDSSLQQASTVRLLPGDLLLLHSDGVTEAHQIGRAHV